MKNQEVLSIFTRVSEGDLDKTGVVLKMYPELDPYFDKGMYVEKITQTCLESGSCMITFVFRHYNTTQSKGN
jgi:hypothetical protein